MTAGSTAAASRWDRLLADRCWPSWLLADRLLADRRWPIGCLADRPMEVPLTRAARSALPFFIIALHGTGTQPPVAVETVAVETVAQRPAPLVIAHRGASGYLPEHTLPAYALAYGMGADFIEPDLVMTRDGVLVALHDIHLEATTDVEQVFAQRHREDGRWYAADFTLAEIKRLSVHERTGEDGRPAFAGRFSATSGGFQVPTLAEVIELVQELNRSTGCRVGLYPETKNPAFHAAEGLDMDRELLRVLERYGYAGREARLYIQSFDPANLKRLRTELGTDLPLVQLISEDAAQSELVSDAGLEEIAGYADGIGPSKRLIEDGAGRSTGGTRLVERAHARGLVVHPYTFRADSVTPAGQELEQELRRFLDRYRVDGLFTDHPDRAVAVTRPARGGRFCAE